MKTLLSFLGILILCALSISAQEKTVQLIQKELENGLRISAKNKNIYPVTIEVSFMMNNLKSSKGNPITLIIPGNRDLYVTDLLPINENESWDMRSKYTFYQGDIFAKHNDKFAYRLPYKRGTKRKVDQGYNGAFSHQGNSKYALDFNMEEGTEVYASRSGLVTDIQESYSKGGNDKNLLERANYISILHNDGTFGQYSHLRKNGVRVKVGQQVKAGEIIGYSGATGYVTGPHLHFVVLRTQRGGSFISIPVKFATKDGIQELQENRSYMAY